MNKLPQALLWTKEKNNSVRCNVCHNRCLIPENGISRCISRANENGEMVLKTYGLISSIAVDPIEKKPLYHFYPGTKVLSVGGWGCNFKCLHCQNWEISQLQKETVEKILQSSEHCLTPKRLVEMIAENDSKGLAWTYNEPCIWFEYTLDSAKLAKEKGYYTVYVTNGYITNEALDMIAPYLDAYRVDLKSFEDEFYQKVCGVADKNGVYESTLRAKEHGMHIECVTNIIPTYNDSEENLRNTAKWIKDNLGADTPWHVTRFFPYHKLKNLEATPLSTLEAAQKIGFNEGLNYVYLGNVTGESNTYCPQCSYLAIKREYDRVLNYTENGYCPKCKKKLNILMD